LGQLAALLERLQKASHPRTAVAGHAGEIARARARRWAYLR